MIAAIYARKSTQQDVADDAKSVTRQVEHARAYAAKKGWIVGPDADCIFDEDDEVSGAEFAKRPGFVRLMNALTPRPPFQVLIMSEESRLGRESIETAYAMKRLIQAGVRVFFYLTDTERTLDNPMDKVMLSLAAFADELEREKARQRAFDTSLRKARVGHVTGGLVFGYDNVPVVGEDGKKSHVVRVVNEAQAALVREIFDRYVSGWGYARIAKALNAAHAPAPRPTEHKPAGWSPSSVRCILLRDLYRGVVTWNRSQKRDKWGRQRQTKRPEGEWLTREAPELRIVSDVLWAAAQDRMARTRTTLATPEGTRSIVRRDIGSRYLLSGFGRCATCGWSMTIITRQHGKVRKPFLGCLSHFKRGPHVCPNARLVPLETADRAVLGALATDVLDPAVVTAVVDLVFDQLRPGPIESRVTALRQQLRNLDRIIGNLTAAIEGGQPPAPLVAKLAERQREREALLAAIGEASALEQIQVDREAIEARVLAQVAEWRALLTESVEDGRTLLREVLTGPLVFTPKPDGYHFRGAVATGELIAGAIEGAHKLASPAGFEPASPP
jgi:site-specific DNA recombinase